MTPTLRKIHRYTWFLLAVLLPLGWLAAIFAIPGPVWQQPVRAGQPDPLPVLLASKASGNFLINLRKNDAGTQKQIEILITKPLTNPNTVVSLDDTTSLGLLGTRGVWRFNLDSLHTLNEHPTLHFEDKIERRTLRTVSF